MTAVKGSDADRVVQGLLEQEPYIFKELPAEPVTLASAFILQIVVTPLEKNQ